jgi:hypothetical protein
MCPIRAVVVDFPLVPEIPIKPEYNRENKNKTMGGVNQKTAPGFANNLNMLRNKYRGSYNRGRNTNI